MLAERVIGVAQVGVTVRGPGLLRPLPPKRAGRAPVAGCAKVGEVYARWDVS